MAIISSILKDNNKTVVLSPDEEKSYDAREETEKLIKQGSYVGLDAYAKDNRIEFQNGSTIEFVAPTKESDVIRGKRSTMSMWLYDYENYNKEAVDEVLQSHIK